MPFSVTETNYGPDTVLLAHVSEFDLFYEGEYQEIISL